MIRWDSQKESFSRPISPSKTRVGGISKPMQCSVCRYELPAGTAFCPNCGSPVSTVGSSPNQGVPPTVFASPPNSDLPPTVMASPTPPPSYQPSTAYGESAPPPPPSSPYGAPPPPYGTPQQPAYGTPAYIPPPQYAQQRPKKNNGCVIALVITLVVVFVIIGGIVAAGVFVFNRASNAVSTASTSLQSTVTSDEATATAAEATATNLLTPSPSNSGGVPDASQVNPTAAANITSAQTAASVDSNNRPTSPKTNFSVGNTVYITYTLAGNAGYATTKIYRDGQFDVQSDSPTTIPSGDTSEAFQLTVNNPGQFVAGIYWCTRSDCSDAALAQVVSFTVS